MNRSRRIVLFGAIIVVAIVVAMPFFRHQTTDRSDSAAPANSNKVELSVNSSVLQPAQDPAKLVTDDSPATIVPANVGPAFTGQLGKTGEIANPQALTVDDAPSAPEGFPHNSGNMNSVPTPSGDVLLQGQQLANNSQRRTHIIQDGDSLPSLAARMLGSADRADEIFQANRDVLSHPDLLPIGQTLVIPAK